MPAQLPTTTMESLPRLIDRAAGILMNARSAAEILEARETAALAYDIAQRSARLAKAKNAHDSLIADAHRVQADALEIEAGAKRRLADEYDAAQKRGEVQKHGGQGKRDIPDKNIAPSQSEVGLSAKDIHEARQVRDAEKADPGIVRRTLDEKLAAGEEPTKASLNKAVKKAKPKKQKKRRAVSAASPSIETQHDRDLRFLQGAWDSACESARTAFLETLNLKG